MYLLVLFLTFYIFSSGAFKMMGPVGTINLSSVTECEEKSKSDDFTAKFELITLDDNSKALQFEINSKIDFDDTITYKADFRKWDNGWKPQLVREGKICEDIQKFGPKLWEKLKESVGGDFPSGCPVKPGSYSSNKYQAISSDFNIPTIYYGQIMTEIKLYKNKELLSCIRAEGNSQAPSKR